MTNSYVAVGPSRADVILLPITLLDAGGAKKPPTELRLFKFGTNRTVKGNFRLTRSGAEQVMAQWRTLNRNFGFDFEHALFDKSVKPQDRVAAGWGHLEVRKDGLWVVGIEWTPDAARKIVNKEFRYLSPAFRDKSGEIVSVANCALTNYPATFDAVPLMLGAAALGGAVPFRPWPRHEGAAWDADAAVQRMRAWAGVDVAEPPASSFRRYAQGFAFVSGAGDKLGDFHLPHHDVVDGRLVTSRKGVEAAGAALQGARGQHPDIPESDLAAVKAHLQKHYHQFKRRAPWESGTSAHLSVELPRPVRGENTRLEYNMAENEQNAKHIELGMGILRGLAATLLAAQACAESDHPGLKDLGADLAAEIPEHVAKIKELFPQIGEPDGDEMEKDRKELAALKGRIRTLSGCPEGAEEGGLLTLSSQAKQKVRAAQVSEQDQKVAKVARLVKLGKIHPQDRDAHITLNMASLDWIEKNGAQVGPKEAGIDSEIQGAVTLNGQGPDPTSDEVKKAQADALDLMGISPSDPRLKA